MVNENINTGEQTIQNTATHFECEIKNLYHTTIEREISHYFNMDNPDDSSVPPQISRFKWNIA